MLITFIASQKTWSRLAGSGFLPHTPSNSCAPRQVATDEGPRPQIQLVVNTFRTRDELCCGLRNTAARNLYHGQAHTTARVEIRCQKQQPRPTHRKLGYNAPHEPFPSASTPVTYNRRLTQATCSFTGQATFCARFKAIQQRAHQSTNRQGPARQHWASEGFGAQPARVCVLTCMRRHRHTPITRHDLLPTMGCCCCCCCCSSTYILSKQLRCGQPQCTCPTPACRTAAPTIQTVVIHLAGNTRPQMGRTAPTSSFHLPAVHFAMLPPPFTCFHSPLQRPAALPRTGPDSSSPQTQI